MQWGPLVLHSHRIASAKKLTHYHRRSSCLQEKQGASLPGGRPLSSGISLARRWQRTRCTKLCWAFGWSHKEWRSLGWRPSGCLLKSWALQWGAEPRSACSLTAASCSQPCWRVGLGAWFKAEILAVAEREGWGGGRWSKGFSRSVWSSQSQTLPHMRQAPNKRGASRPERLKALLQLTWRSAGEQLSITRLWIVLG